MAEKEGISDYFSLEVREVLGKLGTSENGVLENEAKSRLEEYGYNILSAKKEVNIVIEFLLHFKSPLIIILLLAAGISAYFGQAIDAIIIGILILFSVILDFVKEHKAEVSVKKLIDSVKTTATVIRGGEKKEVKTKEVCIGDVVFLSSGDLIPADARIISAKDFFVNQSSLTGESFPCEKTEAVVLSMKSLSELTNIVFSGTSVVSGSATAAVIRTGRHTEFGRLAVNLSKAQEKNEFEIGITNFGYLITKIMIFLVMFIFLFNSLMKNNVLESFMFAVAIAVGITPELLPMIMSVTMAKGSAKMAKKGVIVKKLNSIPTLGSMDVLCTDKTGTLTQNKIELVTYTDIFGKNSLKVLLYSYLNSSYQTGIKNPLDEAIMNFRKIDINNYKKIDEIPFDFFRKKMSIIAQESEKSHYLITKGAPEEIFKVCTRYNHNEKSLIFSEKAKAEAVNYYHKLSAEGYRVLAVATKKIEKNLKAYSKADESSLVLEGFVAFLDPAKKDVKEVILHLEEMGVETKVITGDNELVTKKICSDIGLSIKGLILGSEMEFLSDEALKGRVESTTIFARLSPDQKNRIIHILRSNGHVVGYMGDGINDALSLKNADVGISVNNAVDVAKESADIVLLHKSLGTLKEGIIEGRKAFGNTMKYIIMGLSSNFGNMFSATVAILFLPFLPMLPIQILLINFIYDFSQITIPDDDVDIEWIKKPKRWNLKFIKDFMYIFGPISSIFDILTFFVLFAVFDVSQGSFQTGWFLESLATQTLVIYIIRTKKLPFIESWPSKYLLFSTLLCVALGWMLPYTPIGAFFGFSLLPINIILTLVGIIILYLITIEFTKKIFYKTHDF